MNVVDVDDLLIVVKDVKNIIGKMAIEKNVSCFKKNLKGLPVMKMSFSYEIPRDHMCVV